MCKDADPEYESLSALSAQRTISLSLSLRLICAPASNLNSSPWAGLSHLMCIPSKQLSLLKAGGIEASPHPKPETRTTCESRNPKLRRTGNYEY